MNNILRPLQFINGILNKITFFVAMVIVAIMVLALSASALTRYVSHSFAQSATPGKLLDRFGRLCCDSFGGLTEQGQRKKAPRGSLEERKRVQQVSRRPPERSREPVGRVIENANGS